MKMNEDQVKMMKTQELRMKTNEVFLILPNQ